MSRRHELTDTVTVLLHQVTCCDGGFTTEHTPELDALLTEEEESRAKTDIEGGY